MKIKQQSRLGCIVCLAAWFVVIQLAASILAPGLSRISYPQPLDLLVLAFIPVGAFHAAKYARSGVFFTVYGALASSAFWLYYLFGARASLWADDATLRNMIIVACFVTILLAVVCRFAAWLRYRWEALFRQPEGYCRNCGYNLTGNTSGVCPECGEPVS